MAGGQGLQALLHQPLPEAVRRVTQAATHHTTDLQSQTGEDGLGRTGAPRDAFRQHQQPGRVAAAETSPQLAANLQAALKITKFHGSTAAEAARLGQPQLKMRHRRRHRSTGINHQQRQLQLLLGGPTNQGWCNPSG
jgi:hypothetical protein